MTTPLAALRLAIAGALLGLLAACATPQPFLAPILKASPQSLGHYVGSRLDKGRPVIETGSAARGETRFKPEAAAACRHAQAPGPVMVTLCTEHPLEDASLAFWLEDFAAALDALNARVFGDGPRIGLDVMLYAAGPSERVDFVRRTPLEGETVRLAFVTRTTLLREPFRRIVSQSFAHETHHAIVRARRLLAGGAPQRSAVTATILEEGAAELYGVCGALLATNLSSRAESNHAFRGRTGGVFRDAELRSLLAGDYDLRKPALSRSEIDVAAEMLATTLWSDAIGPRYLAEADRDEGRDILALCTQETLATEVGFRTLLTRHAEDGLEAAPLPAFEGAVSADYYGRYRAAVRRWREGHGLPPNATGA